jgi:hypothetical protein
LAAFIALIGGNLGLIQGAGRNDFHESVWQRQGRQGAAVHVN